MKTYYVYILQCDDKSYYTGVTNDIERRIYEHSVSKDGSYTSWNMTLKLVYVEEYHDIKDAIAREKQIKGWSRKKKELLISEDSDGLQRYNSSN